MDFGEPVQSWVTTVHLSLSLSLSECVCACQLVCLCLCVCARTSTLSQSPLLGDGSARLSGSLEMR